MSMSYEKAVAVNREHANHESKYQSATFRGCKRFTRSDWQEGLTAIRFDVSRRIKTMHNIRGLIFDLDGTLVDSRLDFDLMRQEMELPAGPILEGFAALPPAQAWRRR